MKLTRKTCQADFIYDYIAPRVYYTPEVYDKIQFIVQYCKKEVGWFGLVDKTDKGNYLVNEVYVPEQEVTLAETDISAEAVGALAHELLAQDIDTSKLFYWGHSHVNMAVSPSRQDDDQLLEYAAHCPVFIRGIYNKEGDSRVDVYDFDQNIKYAHAEEHIFRTGMDAKAEEELQKSIDENVEERTYVQTYPHNYGRKGTNANKGNQQQSVIPIVKQNLIPATPQQRAAELRQAYEDQLNDWADDPTGAFNRWGLD